MPEEEPIELFRKHWENAISLEKKYVKDINTMFENFEKINEKIEEIEVIVEKYSEETKPKKEINHVSRINWKNS